MTTAGPWCPGTRSIALWLIAMLLSSGVRAAASDINRERFNPIVASIVKIEAVTDSGSYSLGSGVAVQPSRFVTSCHVTAQAVSITVLYQGLRWPVIRQRANTVRDLCILQVRGLDDLVPVPRGKVSDLRVGTEVAAIGYTLGTGLATQVGTVQALHPLADGTVIQSATYFNSGASGGGLFQLDGRLVGILTFRLKGAEAYYFSIPVDWIESELARSDPFEPVGKLAGASPFWAQPPERLPFFMRAATLQARMLWQDLISLSNQWAEAEPGNAEAWFMQAQALTRLDRPSEAVAAYEHAVRLDAHLAQAWFQLGQLKIRLGQQKEIKRIVQKLEPLDPALASELATRNSQGQPASPPP
ncbi:MAG: trypsin-like peptidase domain-containing protein [Nevskia sp.]|nr:trypsin-like peptidase domain-containing protein [Nevskia sp.]